MGGSAPGKRLKFDKKVDTLLPSLPSLSRSALPQKERKRTKGGDQAKKERRRGIKRESLTFTLARKEEETEGSPPGCQAGWHAT